MQNFQSVYLASTTEALSPLCSLEQVEIILRQQFGYFGGAIDAFKICPVVTQCVRVYTDFLKGVKTIYLGECAGGNGQYLRPCSVKEKGCLLFQVLERQNRVLVFDGPCVSCQSKKRRKIEHPSRFTKYDHLTAEEAVTRLRKERLRTANLYKQLGYTRRMLEKEKILLCCGSG